MSLLGCQKCKASGQFIVLSKTKDNTCTECTKCHSQYVNGVLTKIGIDTNLAIKIAKKVSKGETKISIIKKKPKGKRPSAKKPKVSKPRLIPKPVSHKWHKIQEDVLVCKLCEVIKTKESKIDIYYGKNHNGKDKYHRGTCKGRY